MHSSVRARPHARAVRGRYIGSTKVGALPETLGQCKDLEELCVRAAAAAVRVRGGFGAALLLRALPRRALGWRRAALDAAAAMLPVVGRGRAMRAHCWRQRPDRRVVGLGPEPPGAAARSARRSASNSELAALPAAAEWPKLKLL
jgi:hypothetical protein